MTQRLPLNFPTLQVRRDDLDLFEEKRKVDRLYQAFLGLIRGIQQNFILTNSTVMEAASEKSWAFKSPSGATGIFYYGGFYSLNSGNNDFSPSINFGTANASYAAHFFLVLGGSTTDTIVITVSGTSIQDDGTRTAGDNEVITVTHPANADDYFETSKKWIGQIAIVVTSGTPVQCNYGLCKYWDNNNSDFVVKGFEATWLGGANDTAPDIQLLHHKATGWTYNVGSTPTPPVEIASMATDHSTEDNVINGEPGAWKRADLDHTIVGSGSEGTIIKVVTTANKAFDLGNLIMRITQ